MASIKLHDLQKTFPGGHVAVDDVDLEVQDGELMVLVGPSGCGKSTILRLVAGLDHPSRGRVLIDGADVTDVAVQNRNVAMVFQSYALYPHKTVRENLAFGLKMARTREDTIRARIDEIARVLEISEMLDRKPSELSGGQRQRVALGRALVRRPTVFLLDEPLSNLDATLRLSMRAEIARLHRRFRTTMLYVTHDQQEAMTLGTRVSVLRAGRIEQVGPPLELFHRPANRFVAEFIGSPPMNFFACELVVGDGVARLRHPLFELQPEVSNPERLPGAIDAGIRPHDLELAEAPRANVHGRAEVVEQLGNETIVHVMADGHRFTAVVRAARVSAGDELGFHVAADKVQLFDRRTGLRLASTRVGLETV